MPKDQATGLLVGWEGYRVGAVQRFEAGVKGPTPEVWIDLLRKPGPFICSGCGGACERHHDWEERWVRDLPILDAQTHLCVKRFRAECPDCGPKIEQLAWLARYARVTTRLAESVARLCRNLALKHVAEFYGLGWDTVKAIDREWLERKLGQPDLSGLTLLALDEFALKKGHRYATIFVEPVRKQVLWVCNGRGREDIRPFFDQLGYEGRRRLEAVAIDMNGAYEAEVQAQCPQAQIVYDQFHVLAKYGREVIDAVRAAEARRQMSRAERQVIKGSRWLLLRNGANLKRADAVRLRELLQANRKLATVYVLKDDLKSLWDYRSLPWAAQFFREWYARAIRSRIEPLKRFARRLREKLQGILAHCTYPLHTSLLEGIMNKIKVIKRMAYGFRDDDYFFLKIRAAFPGIPG